MARVNVRVGRKSHAGPICTLIPSKQAKRGKRSRAPKNVTQNQSLDLSNVNLGNSSEIAGTSANAGSQRTTSYGDAAELRKDNEKLLGLLAAKNEEIQMLTKMLKQNKVVWVHKVFRLIIKP